MKKIGDALKAFFKSKGITQKQLSQELNVSQPYINALLSGEKEFGKKQAQIFGEKFGISPNWLLTGTGAMLPDAMQLEADGDAETLLHTLIAEKDKII
ncbi:MAG: helix-turn-helix domain-containing protein, partial [Bacteroides sp.]|nr:helix-turn-helix domain-containing protein [Bacteroides sp.]